MEKETLQKYFLTIFFIRHLYIVLFDKLFENIFNMILFLLYRIPPYSIYIFIKIDICISYFMTINTTTCFINIHTIVFNRLHIINPQYQHILSFTTISLSSGNFVLQNKHISSPNNVNSL